MSNVGAFLDAEFTDLLHPQLLSLGLVTLDGREHYVELDLTTEAGQARVKASLDFVRYGGVLDMWGRVSGAACTDWEMGRRTGEWLLQLAAESGTRVEVCFDYATDWELTEHAIRDSGLWDQVRDVVTPVDVGPLTGSPEGEDAAEVCFRELRKRGLARHHALADAIALRASYIAVKAVAMKMAKSVHFDAFHRLAKRATETGLDEAWLWTWMKEPAFALGGRLPMDVIDEPGGLEVLQDVIVRIAYGVYT